MSFITNALGGLFGTKQQADSATLASQQQADAQNQAAAALTSKLAPYSAIGTSVLPQLLKSLGYQGTFDSSGNVSGISGEGFKFNPFSFNASDLQNTPGYQFTLQQGLKNTNNALSSQGLLGSGAQAKALSDYTTGLAQNTYNQQLQNALGLYQTNYNSALGQYTTNAGQLGNLLNLGQNAAAGTGQAQYNSAVNAGNALAAGTTAAGGQTANTMNSLFGLAGLANQGAATYTPQGGYKSGLSNIYSSIMG
jgi:hypothetical protein